MTTVYTGTNGSWYSVNSSDIIGKGGEGTVYDLPSKTGYVLKSYKPEKRTPELEAKIKAMLARPISGDALNMVAWPVDIVYENNRFAGFVMPKAGKSEPINALYKANDAIPLSQKIIVARNLCAAVNAVHNAGQVCGDLNPANILVDPRSGIITLVDTDSYHITDPQTKYVFRCGVGLGPYLPREIHAKMVNGVNLGNAPLPTFTESTDNFALAVHIFVLLMNGCHPFACAMNMALNQGSIPLPQPVNNISSGFSPFFMSKSGITVPVYAPDFKYLPDELQTLFQKAFVLGHNSPEERPNAVAWYNALSNMLGTLKKCSTDPTHLYPSSCPECPWCKLAINPVPGHDKGAFNQPERGKDLYLDITLTEKEVKEGCKKTIKDGHGNSFTATFPPYKGNIGTKENYQFENHGYPGKNGGRNGDLYITATVKRNGWGNLTIGQKIVNILSVVFILFILIALLNDDSNAASVNKNYGNSSPIQKNQYYFTPVPTVAPTPVNRQATYSTGNLNFRHSDKPVSKNGFNVYPIIFEEELVNCTSLSMELQITEYTGNPFKKWYLYALINNSWVEEGSFVMDKDKNDSMQRFEFSFSKPQTFQSLLIAEEPGGYHSYSYLIAFPNAVVKN